MEFLRPRLCSALSVGLFALITGCRPALKQERNASALKIVVQPERTEPIENSTTEDCGLTDYPVSRSNQEILSDVPLDNKRPPNSDMLAKIAIDKDGKITHLRLLRFAHSNSPNWREINDAALDDIKKWHYKPTLYKGIPVVVCSDVSVTIDF